MSMESSKAAEATQAGGSCNLDEVAENILREKWSAIGQVWVREKRERGSFAHKLWVLLFNFDWLVPN